MLTVVRLKVRNLIPIVERDENFCIIIFKELPGTSLSFVKMISYSLPEPSPAITIVCCSAEHIFLSSCFSSDSLGNLNGSKLEDDLQRVSWEVCVNLD